MGRRARGVALHRLPAARRAVPLPGVRLGDERGLQERDRLRLQRPVVDLGRGDDRDRLPADLPRHPHLDDGGRDPRLLRDRHLRGARDLDAALERRRPEPAAVQPEPRRRQLGRRLQGDGVRDPRLHRLRGLGAARGGGEEPAAHGAAGRRRLGDRDRPLLRAVRLRLGLRRRVRQLRRPGDGRRPVAEPRQGVLEHGLDPGVPRDLQLDRGELERGGERGHARLLLARAQPARAAPARAHPPRVQDAERRDHLDVRLRARALADRRLEVEPRHRLRRDRDRGRAARDRRLHARLRRDGPALLDRAQGRVQLAPALRAADRRDRAVLPAALLPVLGAASALPVQVRQLVRGHLGGGRRADHRSSSSCARRSGSPTSTASTSRTTQSRSWWRSGGRDCAPDLARRGDLVVRPRPRARARGRAGRDGHLRDERLLHRARSAPRTTSSRRSTSRGSTARPGRWP